MSVTAHTCSEIPRGVLVVIIIDVSTEWHRMQTPPLCRCLIFRRGGEEAKKDSLDVSFSISSSGKVLPRGVRGTAPTKITRFHSRASPVFIFKVLSLKVLTRNGVN